MVEFALIVLFGGSAMAAVAVLADSAVRGRNAHRRLTRKADFAPIGVARVTIVHRTPRPALRLVSRAAWTYPAVASPAEWWLRAAA